MVTSNKTYEDGLRDGQAKMTARILDDHKGRLDNHSKRISMLEKVAWIMVGAYGFLTMLPTLQKMFSEGL